MHPLRWCWSGEGLGGPDLNVITLGEVFTRRLRPWEGVQPVCYKRWAAIHMDSNGALADGAQKSICAGDKVSEVAVRCLAVRPCCCHRHHGVPFAGVTPLSLQSRAVLSMSEVLCTDV